MVKKTMSLRQESPERLTHGEETSIKLENVVTPWWIRVGLPLVTWRKPANSTKRVYLTFDDGPTTNTPKVLEILKNHGAQATFFCLGQNAIKNPDKLAAIVEAGHLVANHSHSHLNGWQTGTQQYVDDVNKCQDVLTDLLGASPRYFRPPFGRISIRQLWKLRREFEVVMWDILSMDYQPSLSGEEVANNVIQNATSGSIVLLHDSDLAWPRVSSALPKILEHFSANDFQMCTLDQ